MFYKDQKLLITILLYHDDIVKFCCKGDDSQLYMTTCHKQGNLFRQHVILKDIVLLIGATIFWWK